MAIGSGSFTRSGRLGKRPPPLSRNGWGGEEGRHYQISRAMLRLTELRLPLDHPEDALRQAVLRRLGMDAADLLHVSIARRGYDARKPAAISLVYTLDAQVRDEAAVLRRFADDPRISPTPDTRYRFVARAPEPGPPRPVVIGAGPCGLLAALVLAQMGFRPLVLERGKPVRQRTVDTWGLWRRGVLQPESQRPVRRGRRRHLLRRQALQPDPGPAASRPQGAGGVRQRRRAGGDPLGVQAPHRHLPPGDGGGSDARRDRKLGGEYRFNTRVADLEIAESPDGSRHLRGLVLAGGETIEADHAVLAPGHSARDTLRHPAPPRRRHGGQAVLDRRPHRASAARDRPRPLRPERRQQAPRRRRLPARPPLRERPRRLQLLHVPRRHEWWPPPASPAASSPTA